MSETLSRADKTQTKITWDLILDEQNERLVELRVTVLCAMRQEGGPAGGPHAFTTEEHVAFLTSYRIGERGTLPRPNVPAEAEKLLR